MSAIPVVHVVDNDSTTRESLNELLGSVSLSTACYDDGATFLDNVDPEQPGCIVLALRIPGMSGLELQRTLKERDCPLPVIIIAEDCKVSAAVRAMQEGAIDVLTKPLDDEALLHAVREALHRDEQQRTSSRIHNDIQSRLDALTPREQDVFDAVRRGLTNKEVARELSISPRTVELHRAHMMDKMQASSVAELVEMYFLARASHPDLINQGLIAPDNRSAPASLEA